MPFGSSPSLENMLLGNFNSNVLSRTPSTMPSSSRPPEDYVRGDESFLRHPATKPYSAKSIMVEIVVRIALIGILLAIESMTASERDIYNWSHHALPYKRVERIDYDWLLAVGTICHVAMLAYIYLAEVPDCKTTSSREIFIRYALGATLSCLGAMTMTDFVKKTYSYPRPDYLSRCIGVEDTWGWLNDNQFRSFAELPPHISCATDARGFGLRVIQEGRVSFPSGHSSTSAAIWGFIVFWIVQQNSSRQTYNKHLPTGLKVVLLAVLCMIPMYIGISRVIDGWHHPADVLAGLLLGFVWSALSASLYVPKDRARATVRTPSRGTGTKPYSIWATDQSAERV
eukprot:Gregarina_sp_Poly_1__10471@NODE_762_length_6387_cov_60_360285_g562_i0_p4_GENE_NODE_762_length_6387_cov_60_360285_g562_i0NODE_762_length_6387_cov_60_360285_g562_i0_p4_ORF_typecomplete_len342_score12_61PAP2/PF01569_21/2_2e28PAP2_3/PF14378_6/0_00013Rhomboid/PF01694_22/9_6e03Rhomboid/PF01694_22/0_001DUF4407/PF14362_6/2_2e03DUF4407/PF14362_6/0_011Vma12/PF11712_8/0_23DUF1129/PF06570_11/3_1e02DUF1129/PF06570_11/0_63ABC2_membrane_5/PF13346_6/3_9ABC2_membrane_5/PF13346_6/41_NODE_762_length_6387_cov_60_36